MGQLNRFKLLKQVTESEYFFRAYSNPKIRDKAHGEALYDLSWWDSQHYKHRRETRSWKLYRKTQWKVTT